MPEKIAIGFGDSKAGETYEVAKAIPYPNYEWGDPDIAIVILAERPRHIKPALLPWDPRLEEPFEAAVGDRGTIVGYGRVMHGHQPAIVPPHLKGLRKSVTIRLDEVNRRLNGL